MVVRPDEPYATTFVTAPGASIIYKLSSVEIRAAKEVASYVSPTPQVSLYRDADGLPGSQLYTLTGPDDFLSVDDTEFRTYTFTAPQGASLDAGVAYWVVFAGASGSTHYRVDSTTETAQTGDGWSIGDISMVRDSGVWVDNNNWACQVCGSRGGNSPTGDRHDVGDEPGPARDREPESRHVTGAQKGKLLHHSRPSLGALRVKRYPNSCQERSLNDLPTPLVTVHRDDGGRPAAAPLYTLDNPE